MTDVTLILPNYAPDDQVADRAIQFLHSLGDSLPATVPMITIDNGTQEVSHTRSKLLSMLRRESHVYIHSEKALGYARAVNIGLALAETRYVVVLNNDLTLPLKPNASFGTNYTDKHSWLSAMIEHYENGEEVFDRNKATADKFWSRTLGGPGILSAMDYPCAPVLYDDSWYSLWMSDRDTITKVGYLDETMPYRYHDQDYSIRMVKAGFKVQRTGKVVVTHDEATTYKKMSVDESPEKKRMIAKHGVETYVAWRSLIRRPLGS